MRIRISKCIRVVVAVALLGSGALLSSSVALASNMGFKMNRVVNPIALPAPKGQNLVALPFRNPYQNAQDICVALGLTNTTGKVIQINAATGATLSHTCGNAGPYSLANFVGVRADNPSSTGGILVGSHQSNVAITLQPIALPAPKGDNYFPVPYHTTNVTAQDLCLDLTLPAGGKVIRIDSLTGATLSHTCGNAGPYALILGESVLVQFSGPAISIPAGHPAHF